MDTVVGRAIVVVIFWSAVAVKRLLELGFFSYKSHFRHSWYDTVCCCLQLLTFDATYKHLVENWCYLSRHLKVLNCNWFCDLDEVWITVNCSLVVVTVNLRYIIINRISWEGLLQMNISLKPPNTFCIFKKKYYDVNCIHSLGRKQFIVIFDKAWRGTVAAVYSCRHSPWRPLWLLDTVTFIVAVDSDCCCIQWWSWW